MHEILQSNLVQEKHNQKKKFNERYEVVRQLGKGSMGDICLVKLKEESIGGSAYEADGAKKKGGALGLSLMKISKIKGKFQKKSPKQKSNDTDSDDSPVSPRASIGGAKDLPDSERRKSEIVYALKSIPLTKMDDESLTDELKNEVDVLRSMDHPNIVKAHEVYYHKDEQICLIMQCCSGGDLTKRAPYSEITAKRISKQLLTAIKYMHDHGIVHRDLKCENIMFESENKDAAIKIIDFGLSRKFSSSQSQERIVMTNQCGSLYTVAPQIVLNEGYTSKADLWSCGVIIYYLLSNKKPFAKKARKLLEEQIARGEYYDMDGKCEDEEYNDAWLNISKEGKHLVKNLLIVEESERLCAAEALKQNWFTVKNNVTGSITSAELEDHTSPAKTLPSSPIEKTQHVSDRTLSNISNALLHYRDVSALKKMALNVIAHNSTTEEIKELRDVFANYDTLENGIITREEFQSALEKFEFTDKTIQEIFESIDVNGNGHIMYTEFLAATLEAQGQIEEERIAEAFNVIDSNNTGYIQPVEISQLLGKSKNLETDIRKTLNKYQGKENGTISYAEFLRLFRKERPKTNGSV